MGPAVGPMIRWVTPPRVVSSHITFGPWFIFGGWYPCAIFTIFSKSATATACHGKWINKSFTAWYFKSIIILENTLHELSILLFRVLYLFWKVFVFLEFLAARFNFQWVCWEVSWITDDIGCALHVYLIVTILE